MAVFGGAERPGERGASFTKGLAMNGNDTILGKEAEQNGPKTNGGDSRSNGTEPKADESGSKPDASGRKAPSARRATRLALEQDAIVLREEIGEGLSVTEICARHGWTRSAYHRRARLAHRMALEEYHDDRAFLIYLRREARYRLLQRQAEARLQQQDIRAGQAAQAPANPRNEAALTDSSLKMFEFIASCEDKIYQCARNMNFVASEIADKEKKDENACLPPKPDFLKVLLREEEKEEKSSEKNL